MKEFLNGKVQVHHGDCLDVLRTLADASVDSVVTDPPYEIGFMGRKWDSGSHAHTVELWSQVLRVLKPGGHLLAFAGTRTYHRLATAIEGAGFEIRDMVAWVYGTGFNKVGMLRNRAPEAWCKCDGEPKTEHDVRQLRKPNLSTSECDGETIENALLSGMSESCLPQQGQTWSEPEPGRREQPGMEGRTLHRAGQGIRDGTQSEPSESESERLRLRTHPSDGEETRASAQSRRGNPPCQPGHIGQPTGKPAAICDPPGALGRASPRNSAACPNCGGISKTFDGFAGSLKPALEPVCMARKPLIGTLAENVLAHGTGGLNVDGCRVGTETTTTKGWKCGGEQVYNGRQTEGYRGETREGRFPANLVHDGSEEVLAVFPETTSGSLKAGTIRTQENRIYGKGLSAPGVVTDVDIGFGDTGSAARFFYTAKADDDDRLGSKHPTVKPLNLIQYFVRLVTPPGGTVLDMFAGTGTTGEAAWREGMRAILIEREAEYQACIAKRMALALAGPDERRREIIKAKGLTADAGPLFGDLFS